MILAIGKVPDGGIFEVELLVGAVLVRKESLKTVANTLKDLFKEAIRAC